LALSALTCWLLQNASNFFLLDAIVPLEMSSVSKSRINDMTDQNQEIRVLTLEEKQRLASENHDEHVRKSAGSRRNSKVSNQTRDD